MCTKPKENILDKNKQPVSDGIWGALALVISQFCAGLDWLIRGPGDLLVGLISETVMGLYDKRATKLQL